MDHSSTPPGVHGEQIDADHICEVIDKAHELARFCKGVDNLAWAAKILELEIRRRNFTPDGYLYVLRAGDYYKIGRSKTPTERIKQLKIQLPFPVEVVYLFPCEDMVAVEGWYHWLFADQRVNGEWFLLHDALLASFELNKDRGGLLYRRGDGSPTPVVIGRLEQTI